MARKVPKNLLALGSAAIVGVYAIGFARTAITPASAGSGVPPLATVASATVTAPVDASTAIARALASATITAPQTASATSTASTAAASPASTATYRDGTYSGTGTSRMGNITAEVTVQGGQIAAVRITNATTHYPVSRISRLPGEVVSRQSANISVVSGATYSTAAFKQAVAQALATAAA